MTKRQRDGSDVSWYCSGCTDKRQSMSVSSVFIFRIHTDIFYADTGDSDRSVRMRMLVRIVTARMDECMSS